MALVTPTVESKRSKDLGSEWGDAFIVTWVLTSGGDIEGSPFVAPTFNDVTVQAYGTDWGGVTLSVRGSIETDAAPSNWINSVDPSQTAIALTASGGKIIFENWYQYSPKLSGTPNADVTVKMLFTKKGR